MIFQKFEDAIGVDIDANVKLFLDTANAVGGVEADFDSIQRYLSLGHALGGYSPTEHFSGNTVLVQAKQKNEQAVFIHNDDYNVTHVSRSSE